MSPYHIGERGGEMVAYHTGREYDRTSGCPSPMSAGEFGEMARRIGMIAASSSMESLSINRVNRGVDVDLDSLADKLWEKMYQRKPIVPCKYCSAMNVFDNPCCIQCGGPMGA